MPAAWQVPIALSEEEIVAVVQRVIEPAVGTNTKGAVLTVVANTAQIIMFAEDIVAAEPEHLTWCAAIASSAAMVSPAVLVSTLLVASVAASA